MKSTLALTMTAVLIASAHPGRPAFGAPATSTAGGVPARGSAGCGAARPVTPGKSARFTSRVGNLDRVYRVHLPLWG